MHRAVPLLALTLLVPGAEAACTLPAGPLPTQTRAVFILDTSGSMRGIGDGQANIFGRVKAALNRYVREARPDRLDLVTFDGGPQPARSYTFPRDAARWNNDLAALRADGRNTYLYRSVARALAPLPVSRRSVTNVVILTDGIDNDPDPRQTAARALAAFQARGPLDTLHYVALGTRIPQAARAALSASGYARALTVPVGQVPDLARVAPGTTLRTVRDPARVPVPFPEGSRLSLGPEDGAGVRLASETVTGGQVQLSVPRGLPWGTPALLCATSGRGPGTLERRVLLRLEVGPPPGLTWLNPGADRTLGAGESVTLRYRLESGARADGATLTLPPGLAGELEHLPGGRELGVRLTSAGLEGGQAVTPGLRLAGVILPLAAVTGRAGGRTVPVVILNYSPLGGEDTAPAPGGGDRSGLRRLAAVLGGLLLAALLGLLLLVGLRRSRRRQTSRPATPNLPAAPVPTVEGLHYGEDRTLALVGQGGLARGVSTPLGGAFDLGQVARVPHLSGLRLEQGRDGLQVLRVPGDLEVSQGARLLRAGDIVRPGTRLGVAVARPARSPWPPLGSLVGLGLPLRLKADGVTLHLVGPYGDHALTLGPGVTDLGAALGAPALGGLKVTPSGPHILLAEVPPRLAVRRPGEDAPLRPGTYLPEEAHLDLPAQE